MGHSPRFPLHRVAGISADLAPQLDLNAGAARTALRKAVLAARHPPAGPPLPEERRMTGTARAWA